MDQSDSLRTKLHRDGSPRYSEMFIKNYEDNCYAGTINEFKSNFMSGKLDEDGNLIMGGKRRKPRRVRKSRKGRKSRKSRKTRRHLK
jgi:hypothetical protein